MKIVHILVILILLLCLIATVGFVQLSAHIPRLPDQLSLLANAPATEIYARDGELIRSLGGREYISIDRISPHFLNAVVAAEDKRFYKHHGVDHIATARSLYLNVVKMGKGPGGSSITQQLAKNLFFKFHRSWKRKLLEALAAMAIEDRFSKDKILETYCNLVYFGPYSYGIERASSSYFGKHASDLELHEAVLLAGILNSPGIYDPFKHPERAKKRQIVILRRMAKAGMLDQTDIDSIASVPFDLSSHRPQNLCSSFPIDYTLQIARNEIGKELVNYGGVLIRTTLDMTLQNMGEQTLANGLSALEQKLAPLPEDADTRLEGALVAIDVASGDVRALVGGRNYSESQYNRAIYAKRQPGSSFKPVIYLTALEKLDISPVSVYNDSLISYKLDRRRVWKPPNYSRRYQGAVILKYALMKSLNTVAAQLIHQTKPDAVINTAARLGIREELKPNLSLALGSQGIPPLQLATMIATIANQGVSVEPHMVRRIEERGGETLYERLSVGETRFSAETISILIDMLSGVIDGGTGSVIRRKGFRGAAFGKTGTTDDYRDAWFVGSTPTLAVAVWVGYDDYRPMRYTNGNGVTGGGGAAPIWADFIIKATAGSPSRAFRIPDNVSQVYANVKTGEISEDLTEGFISVMLFNDEITELLNAQKQDELSDLEEISPHAPTIE